MLAHTERPDAPGEDLSGRPLVAQALTEYEASGVWAEGDRLYDAVVVPVARGLDLSGFLLIGLPDRRRAGPRGAGGEPGRGRVLRPRRRRLRQVGTTLGEAEGRELAAALREAERARSARPGGGRRRGRAA